MAARHALSSHRLTYAGHCKGRSTRIAMSVIRWTVRRRRSHGPGTMKRVRSEPREMRQAVADSKACSY